MSYTEKEFNYYLKKPKQINASLDEDLLLALVDVNSSWFSYMRPHTLEMVKKVIAIDPTTFQYADRTVFTIQYLEEVINEYPMLIQYVYEPNDDLIKVALRKDLNVLQYLKRIPVSIQTWILSQNGMILEHIDAAEQTEELVEIAIRENINAYKYAYIKTLTLDLIVLEQDPTRVDIISGYHPELIDYIVDYNPRFITKFLDTPGLVTDELKRRAIAVDSSVYRLIPTPDLELMKYAALVDLDLMDYMPYSNELITYVIEYNGLALKYVRKKDLRTIRKAIEQNVLALDYVEYPRDFLIAYAFTQDGLAIKYIENPTVEQYTDAVHRNGYAIEFIPPEVQTKTMQTSALSGAGVFAIPYIVNPADDDIILEIIRKEPGYIFRIEEPTNSMLITAFNSTGQLILFYDKWEERFDNEVIEAALTEDGTILEKVESITRAMVFAAMESFPAAIQWYDYQDLEIAKAAVEADVRVLYFVKQSVMDEELLALALELDPEFFTRTEGEMTWEQWQALQEG